jgi:hypothetical protein
MCEVMVIIKARPNPDPIIDATDCYKVGDIVVVQEDGHPWGLLESKQAWIAAGNNPADWHGITALLKIPGPSKAKAEALMAEDSEGTNRRARRLWKLAIADVPNAVKQAVQQDGEYTTSVAAIKNYLKNKIDNTIYSGLA